MSAPSDFLGLLPGHTYRDRSGDSWVFLSATPLEERAGFTLHVRRLPSGTFDALIFSELPALERLEMLPSDRPLYCACEEPSWSSLLEQAAAAILLCRTCSLVIGLEPLENGARQLPLSFDTRSRILAAAAFDAARPIRALFAAAASENDLMARAVIDTKLLKRKTLLRELAIGLVSNQPAMRYPALGFAARMASAPKFLAAPLLRCLRAPIDPDPLGEELLWVMMALYNVASEILGFRQVVAEIVRRIEKNSADPRAELSLKVGRALLEKMDAARKNMAAARRVVVDEVVALAREHKFEDTLARIVADQPENEGYEIVGRAALAEEAGDKLASVDSEAARWLWNEALKGFQIYASWSTSGGEGMARMLDVNRVEKKLQDDEDSD